MLWIALVSFILVHGPAGHPVEINVEEISHLSPPKNDNSLTANTGCIITMVSGKFVTCRETCAEVLKMIDGLLRE